MDYLTRHELVSINEHMGALNGSSHNAAQGLRDDGALEAVVMRPQMAHYSDLINKTAAIMEAIVLGEPFLSHNQRTAVAAADIFMRMNGNCLSISSNEAYVFLNARYFRKEFTIDIMTPWLIENSTSNIQ